MITVRKSYKFWYSSKIIYLPFLFDSFLINASLGFSRFINVMAKIHAVKNNEMLDFPYRLWNRFSNISNNLFRLSKLKFLIISDIYDFANWLPMNRNSFIETPCNSGGKYFFISSHIWSFVFPVLAFTIIV